MTNARFFYFYYRVRVLSYLTKNGIRFSAIPGGILMTRDEHKRLWKIKYPPFAEGILTTHFNGKLVVNFTYKHLNQHKLIL